MTNEEAIKSIQSYVERHKTERSAILIKEALNMTLKALKKQIPSKPTPHIVQPVEAPIQIGNGRWQKGTTVYECPNCKEWVSKTYKHCIDCGQALDWRDSE